MHWYVVSTKPNLERQAEQNITRVGIECFLPLLKESKIIRRIKRTVINPLFPGYLFVRVDLTEHFRTVTYARGVRRIVGFGSSPVEVDSVIIDAIKSRMHNTQVYMLEGFKDLRPGQVIRIKDGPLGGLEAVFMRQMQGHQRAMVLLHTLGFQSRAVVCIDQIAPHVAA